MDRGRFEIEILPLYKRIYGMSLAIVGDVDEAADVVQETFALLWARRDSLDRVESAEAYSRAVARNICLKHMQLKRQTGRLDELTDYPSDGPPPDVDIGLGHIRGLIDGLPPGQRRVMVLSVYGGCSNEEIMEITGASADNVRQLLSRARKRIKELYNK